MPFGETYKFGIACRFPCFNVNGAPKDTYSKFTTKRFRRENVSELETFQLQKRFRTGCASFDACPGVLINVKARFIWNKADEDFVEVSWNFAFKFQKGIRPGRLHRRRSGAIGLKNSAMVFVLKCCCGYGFLF